MKKSIILFLTVFISFALTAQVKKLPSRPVKKIAIDSFPQKESGYYFISPLTPEQIKIIFYAIQHTSGLTSDQASKVLETLQRSIHPITFADTTTVNKVKTDSITLKK